MTEPDKAIPDLSNTSERRITFEKPSHGYRRFFSGGHLDYVKVHLDGNGIFSIDDKLWVRAWDSLESAFIATLRHTFLREEQAREKGETFSEKVVITGVVQNERVRESGSMNDSAQYIEGSIQIDRLFLVKGKYLEPEAEEITGRFIGNEPNPKH